MADPTAPPPRVEHAWPTRMLRTLQFGLARLTSGDGLVTARAAPFGLTFTGPAADVITRHIYRLGAHEPAITRYLLEQVRLGAGDVALDVGANLGWYSVLLQRLSVPGARILLEYSPQSLALAGLPSDALVKLLESSDLAAQAFVDGRPQPVSYGELARADSQLDLLLSPRA